MALHLGDDASHRSHFNTMLSSARSDGAAMEVLYGQHLVSLSEFAAGDWAAVRRSAEDASVVGPQHRSPSVDREPRRRGCACSAALQGTDDYEDLVGPPPRRPSRGTGSASWRPSSPTCSTGPRPFTPRMRAVAAESFHHLTQLRVPPVVRLAASARISAAVHAQDVDCATSWVNEVEALGVATDQPWALAAAYHGHALLAPAADAPALFETALAASRRGAPSLRAGVHPTGLRRAPPPRRASSRSACPPQPGADLVPGPARRTP